MTSQPRGDQPPVVVNAHRLAEISCEDGAHYGGGYKPLTAAMVPREGHLGVVWGRTGPGRAGTVFHYHLLEDEVFFVLSGVGLLRYGDELVPLRAGDCVSCPAGTRVGHQIANPSVDEQLVYLAMGYNERDEVAVYPDSGKVMVRSVKTVGRLTATNYLDGEPDVPRIFSLVRGEAPGPPKQDGPPPAPPSGAAPADDTLAADLPPVVVNVADVPAIESTFGQHWGAADKLLTPGMRPRGGRLGVNWTCVAPGRTASPFHTHQREDEVFYVLSGEGVLRYGDALYPLAPGDCASCPAGTGVAHQIANTGRQDLIYLAIGPHDPHEVCTYPDTGKVMVRALQTVGRLETTRYMSGEPDRPTLLALAEAAAGAARSGS